MTAGGKSTIREPIEMIEKQGLAGCSDGGRRRGATLFWGRPNLNLDDASIL